MKKSLRFITTAVVLTIATLTSACGNTKDVDKVSSESGKIPTYKSFENPDEEGLFFGIYVDPTQQTVEAYQKVKDCGVRTVVIDPWNGTALNSDGLGKALDCCEEVGLDAFILVNNSHMTEHEEELESFVDLATVDYTKYPAFKGVYAFDEPSMTQMDWIVEDMKKWESSIYKDYIYLVNMMRSDETTGTDTAKYLQTYSEKVLSKNDDNILIYDVYPLYAKVGDKTLPYLRDFTLPTLESFAKLAKEQGSEFYAYLQTYCSKDGEVRDMVSVNDARFNVAYHLAYGVKGFTCFTYATLSQFGDSMVSGNGQELPKYYYIQEVFSELKNWEHVYKAFDWEGTMTLLGEERGYGAQDESHIKELQYSLDSHERIESIDTEYDLLVGTFKDAEDNDGFLFTSYTDPYYMKDNEIKVTFNDTSKALIYYNGELLTNDEDNTCYLLKDGVLEYDLEAGDYLFVIPIK